MQEPYRMSAGSEILKDMEKLMEDIEQVDLHLPGELIPEKVILLLGETKAGKTTLMYYLLGKKLIREMNDQLGLYQMKPEAKIFDALIGNDYQSTTVYPNIPTELGEDNVLVIDMPGFSDTRYVYRLLNIYIIREVIKKIQSVHVSLVISNECFEANSLMSIIERNCLLLNEKLLCTPNCLSFILTKIEEEEELETFQESLQVLREEMENRTAIENIAQANVYLFKNTDPEVNDGIKLKLQVISENTFFPINEKPENLLSQNYADVISGEENKEGFLSFLVELLHCIEETLVPLVNLFKATVELHHQKEIEDIFRTKVTEEEIRLKKQKISEYSQQILVWNTPSALVYHQLSTPPTATVAYLNLINKFYRIQPESQRNDEIDSFLEKLELFITRANILQSEESIIPKELRANMFKLFKFCSSAMRTIAHNKNPEFIDICSKLCTSQRINQAITNYQKFAIDADLLSRVAHSEVGLQHLSQVEEFRQLLLSIYSDFAFDSVEEVVENVSVPVRGEIKNKKINAALQDTMKMSSRQPEREMVGIINITEITKDSIVTIKSMPIGSNYLKSILTAISKFRPELQFSKDPLKTQFGRALFRKAALILQKLQMFEEAVHFYLAIPAELEADNLINSGICFKQLSPDFITSFLLPYYSQWNPSFEMVEKLYNYLTLYIYDYNDLLENEQRFANILQQMHSTDFSKVEPPRRLDYSFVDFLLQSKAKDCILQTANRNEQRLRSSDLISLKGQFFSLTSL